MTGATVAAEEFPAIETPAGPLRPEQRLVAPDIIRGIAVFGLVWVNFNDPATSVLDRAARWVMVVFAAGKFYTLFSVLFGVTLAMQLDRAEMRGDRFGWRWVRRMAVLYVIAWLNAVFMWGGDILREYAVAGVALLLFARRSDRTVLVAAAALTLMALPRESLSVQAVRLTRGDLAAAKAHAQALPMARIGPFRDALEHGTFGDVVRTRVDMITALAEHRGTQPPAGPLNLFPLTFLALFLVGLWAGRHQIIQRPDEHLRFLRRVAILGSVLGLTLALTTAANPPFVRVAVPSTGTSYGRLLDDLSQPLLSFAYLAALLLLLRRDAWVDRLRWFAPVGRMALTCYIMQWGIISWIRFSYGLGLDGKLGQAACTGLAILIFIIQMVLANLWLKRFSFGPVEWLWRTLSYRSSRKPLASMSSAIG